MDANERTACLADDALVDRLGRTLGIADPPPPGLQKAARELLTWRTVDAELGDLLGTTAAHATGPAD